MFVYVIVNRETLKIYVGQHKGDSLKQYLQRKLSAAAHHEAKGSYLFASMRKHPKECWSIHPLISDLQTREECNYWEKLLIKALKAQHPNVGYNICDGGEGFSGPFTEEHRAKLRAAIANRPMEVQAALNRARSEKTKGTGLGNTRGRGNKGNHYPKSPAFRQQVSQKLKGQKLSAERIQKSANARRGKSHQVTPEGRKRMATMEGKKHSSETLAKMSQSQTGRMQSEESKQKMRKSKSLEAVQHMKAAGVLRPRKVCPHGGMSKTCRDCARARYKKWYWSHKS